jgi:tetratricopeptide (TPR) repeat protein
LAPPHDPIASLRAALRGHYEFERELGQGAFATVYLARDLKHERKVAIKVLHADPNSETGEIRFIREIRMLARLQHPNILPLHDSGHVESLLYYVMPYVSGETLRDRIHRERKLPWQIASGITRDVADALAYAHGQGIIHRDIKPENILLSAGHPILADFGIARAIDIAGVRQLTQTGMGSPGTPAYMSPEQLLGEKEIDARSDIYSLGCVLFEMLAGYAPFTGKDGFVKRFTEPAPSISKARPELPAWIGAAVAKTLERRPDDRYQTAGELAASLIPESVEGKVVPALPRATPVGQTTSATRSSREESPRALLVDAAYPKPERNRATELFIKLRAWPRVVVSAIAILLIGAAGARTERLRNFFAPPAPLDSTRLVIVPLIADSREHMSLAVRVSNGLYDALEGDWDGLRVVEATRVTELTGQQPPRTQSEALDLARRVGARRVIWGQVLPGPRLRATLYDAEAGTREHEIALDHLPRTRADYSQIALELLKVPDRPAAANAGDGATRSYPAWRAYGLGHVALAKWDLARAESEFAAAAGADPGFASAQLWLAQTRALRSYDPVEAWSENVARALAVRNGLHDRDSTLALALRAMSDGEYGAACNAYEKLVTREPRDFLGWYGLGFCGLADRVLIPDPQRPDGWRFRSSFLHAGRAFDQATQLEPRLFTVLPFDTLLAVAPIQASQLRVGVTDDGSRRLFLAYPSLSRDTLAYRPFPLAAIQGSSLQTAPKTANLAAQQARVFLLRIVVRWIRNFPQSAEAQEALAILQEANGELWADRNGVPSALTAVLNAERLATTPGRRNSLVVREIRLRLKRSEFERARALSDSILQSAQTTGKDLQPNLAGLAALTGRSTLARRFISPRSVVAGTYDPAAAVPNEAITNVASALFVQTALGVCSSDLDRLSAQLDSLLESYVSARQQAAMREALTERSWSMATPCRSSLALRIARPVDRLYRMQQALARSQANVVRAEFDSLNKLRENDRPGDVSPDVMFQEAWLLATIGDTTAAIRKLDQSLTSLPSWGNLILDQVPQTAGLVRAMMLRADLARSRRDFAAAQKWARAVTVLWANADAALQADVRRMRSIIQQSVSSTNPNPSSRR